MLHFIWIVVIGFVAGLVAKMVMPGKDPGGFIITALLGIAGSVIISYLGSFLGLYSTGAAGHFIAGVIGAVLLLALYRLFKKKAPQA